MRTIVKVACKELWKKKVYTFLLFVVCVIDMNTVVSSITNTTAETYQQKVFERHINIDLKSVLRLHYYESAETQEFADNIPTYLQYISGLDGVDSVGQFERSGINFAELQDLKSYEDINRILIVKAISLGWQHLPVVNLC